MKDIPSFLRFVLRRWQEDRCPQIAGSLTYTTLLALVPAFAVAISLLSSMPFFATLMVEVKRFVAHNLNPAIADRVIRVYMEQFAQHAARLTWLGVAIVFALSVWLLLIMDRSFNTIWRAHRSRPHWRSALLYAAVLVAGPLLIGMSMSITTYLVSLSATFGAGSRVHATLLRLWPVTFTAVAFFLIYRLVPHRSVRPRHALLGAIVAAGLFELAKEGFAVYVRYAPTYSVVYGAFAAVPMFLIWIYISWLVVLFGAELAASAVYWRDRSWKRPVTGSTRFREAIAVARSLLEARHAEVSFDRLLQETSLDAHELDDTLAQLANAGIVDVRAGGYALTPDAVRELASLTVPQTVMPPELRKAKRGKARTERSSR